jgi:GT2 family glycosyltransferase
MISVIIISKDESELEQTLEGVVTQAANLADSWEIIVVDASERRLDDIRLHYQDRVRWVDFERPEGVVVSIPHQRNVGVHAARGDVIVFTDAGCYPERGWLESLIAPLHEGEEITAGLTLASPGSVSIYDRSSYRSHASTYLKDCATINLAFRREVFAAVGGFDESFAYGSDLDFSWRLTDAGYRIRSVRQAVIRHNWGTRRRQLRRAYLYGRARVRLYQKHASRRRDIPRNDPAVVVYAAFLLCLPVTLVFPLYPALLLIPAWRNRADGATDVVLNHLSFGAGVLAELMF